MDIYQNFNRIFTSNEVKEVVKELIFFAGTIGIGFGLNQIQSFICKIK